MPTNLDADQVIKAIYDEPANRIRTDAAVSATFGDLEVTIQSDEDDIAIGNRSRTNFVDVTTNSELKVISTAQPGVDIGDITVNNGPGAAAINIQDGGNSITVDGTVTISSGLTKSSINTFNEISALASGSETTIVTYTAPIAKVTYLIRAEVAGENIARYGIFLNASVIARRYTYFGGDLSTEFEFENDDSELPGLELIPGDIIVIKVLHNRPSTADFSARIQTLEVG